METIQQNSDFLFLYEAINCNPNGDPDQENKPRMDYDTKTNLVTDVRIKRFLRDYLKSTGSKIFVDMEGDSKVSPEEKLKVIIKRFLSDENFLTTVFKGNEGYLNIYNEIIDKAKGDFDKVLAEITKKDFKHKKINFHLLEYLIKEEFIDIRMFGGAFAVPGFNHSYTGAIQLNWGYSLNKVELIDSNSIVTIMNDETSTFGKDHRLHYSLLALNGTINKYAAKTTGLTEADRDIFRESIWNCIPAMPTRSKLNQYPKLYIEIVYNDNIHNGYFGDLRSYIKANAVNGLDDRNVRSFSDIELVTKPLLDLIKENTGPERKIKDVIIKTSRDVSFKLNS